MFIDVVSVVDIGDCFNVSVSKEPDRRSDPRDIGRYRSQILWQSMSRGSSLISYSLFVSSCLRIIWQES